MATIDFSQVCTIFTELSGCDDDKLHENISIIENEIFTVENLIDDEKFTDSYKTVCEYCAAVCAYFDYLCKEGSKEKIVLSENGSVVSGEDYSKRIPFAETLRKNALRSISEILKDTDFLFMDFGKEDFV